MNTETKMCNVVGETDALDSYMAADDGCESPLVRLFHFTCLCYLPSILQHGIQRGEVPVDVYPRNPNAANLTGYGNRAEQEWCNSLNTVDKTKVRLTVEVPEFALTSFSDIKAAYRMSDAWVNIIDPLRQRDRWFFAFDGVAAEQIVEVAVATVKSAGYDALPEAELDTLLSDIGREQERAGIVSTPSGTTCNPDKLVHSWLFDGPRAKAIRKEMQQHKNEKRQRSSEKRAKRRLRKLKKSQKKRNR